MDVWKESQNDKKDTLGDSAFVSALPASTADILPPVPATLSLNTQLEAVKNDSFYRESPTNFISDPQADDLLMDQLKLHQTEAKIQSTVLSEAALNDDELYKSSKITGENSTAFANDDKIFDYQTFSDPKSYIRFTYSDIPKFLNLIFAKLNSQTSSNNKNPAIPAAIAFQMIRYSFYKKHNMSLAINFLELFVNRVYLIIEDDINGTLMSPQIQQDLDENDPVTSTSTPGTPIVNENTPQLSKKQLMQAKVRKKNDIVLIAYWISVINHLYYYLLRQEGFFTKNPSVLKKLVSVLNDLMNEFLSGITNRLVDLIDDCLLNYSSIPNLQKGLLFQNDWNFFKKETSSNNANNQSTFQEILDNLYPPDLKRQLQPSPIKFLQVLEAIIYVFRLYNISSIIMKNLLSRVFVWLNHTTFNKILSNKNKKGKNYLTRTFAIQLRLNLSVIEDWIRSISKNLVAEDQSMNPRGLTNEEYYLSDDELMMVIRDYPDDVIDFKTELTGFVSRFKANKRFYDGAVREKEERERKEKEEKERIEKEKKEKKEKEKKENREKEKKESTNKESAKESNNKTNGITTKEPKKEELLQLKIAEPVPFTNLEEEEEEQADQEFEQIDIRTVAPPFISDFYYGSLYSIFKHHLQILYNLLEYLQVGTTCIEAIVAAIEQKNSKSAKTLKQVEEEVNNAVDEFLNQDILWLNMRQIHYISKNYKYELDETKISRKVLKHMSKDSKQLLENPSYYLGLKSNLKFTDYLSPTHSNSRMKSGGIGAISPDDYLVYLNPLTGRSYPVCLPTKQELINKYGAGMIGTNRDNLIKNQPYLNNEIRDMVDAIRDQLDYKQGFDEESEDEALTRPEHLVSPVSVQTGTLEQAEYTDRDKFQGLGILDDVGMSRPESSAAKVWELNSGSRNAKKQDDFEYNPW